MSEEKLSYSFTWLTELPEKLETLSGLDYRAAAARVRKKNNAVVYIKTDEDFQEEIAAAALGVHPADIRELPLRQYSQLLQIVFDFLLKPESAQSENSEQ